MSKNEVTHRFSMDVTPAERERIRRLARRQGTPERQAVLDAVARALEAAQNGGERRATPPAQKDRPWLPDIQPGSALDGCEDLIPHPDEPGGPPDLSTNPKYLEDMGRD